MPELDARRRARLPANAFAYVDSQGRRRLPINDEAHVRNALARFNQVRFEDDAARERARRKVLLAARRYGIVPVGFISGQLRSERLQGEADARRGLATSLPTGAVTFLLSDLEGSTALLQQLGDRYGRLLAEVRRIHRTAVRRGGGHEVDARADEFFAVFERPSAALAAALAIEARLRGRAWPEGLTVRARLGLHGGRPTLSETGYVGLAVHTVARICAAGHGGQILLSGTSRAALEGGAPAGVGFRELGPYRLRGLPEPVILFQVVGPELPADFPAPRGTP
jgi:class 3 adenylate cyclase